MKQLSELERLSIMTVLNTMMKSSFFSVCAIDKASKILGVDPSQHPSYKILNALHCVSFSDMHETVKSSLPDLIQDCLSLETKDIFVDRRTAQSQPTPTKTLDYIDVKAIEVPEVKKGFMARLGFRK